MKVSYLKIILSFASLTSTTPAFSQSKKPSSNAFDPKEYIQSQDGNPDNAANHKKSDQVDASAVKESEVVVKGIKYKVFKSKYGAIYLPSVNHISKDDIERGLCANHSSPPAEICDPSDKDCLITHSDSATLLRAEAPLSDNFRLYSDLIQKIIRQNCAGNAAPPSIPYVGELEIGVEMQDRLKRNPTKYRIFNKGLKPQFGFGLEW